MYLYPRFRSSAPWASVRSSVGRRTSSIDTGKTSWSATWPAGR